MSGPTPDALKPYQVIYPQYINKKFTQELGRRIPISKCLDDPTPSEVFSACTALRLKAVLEPTKGYPASQASLVEMPPVRGRVRVLFKQPLDKHYVRKSEFDTQTRNLVREDIPNKKTLLCLVADEIRKIRARSPVSTAPKETSGGGGKKAKK